MKLEGNSVYCFTIDENIEEMGTWLCKSIVKNSPKSDIIVYTSNLENLSEETSSLLKDNCSHIIEGEIPIEDFPISYKIEALQQAEKLSDKDYKILLDTDTILLNPLEIPNIKEQEQVLVKPADFGAKYWCHEDSIPEWKKYSKIIEKEYSYKKVKSRRDNKKILPFWNSGVVISKNYNIGKEWLEIHKKLKENKNFRETFFSDQIALALTIMDKNKTQIKEENNFLIGGRLSIKEKPNLLHYGKKRNINTIKNKNIKNDLDNIGIPIRSLTIREKFGYTLDILSAKSGKILNYKQKDTIKSIIGKVLDVEVTK